MTGTKLRKYTGTNERNKIKIKYARSLKKITPINYNEWQLKVVKKKEKKKKKKKRKKKGKKNEYLTRTRVVD